MPLPAFDARRRITHSPLAARARSPASAKDWRAVTESGHSLQSKAAPRILLDELRHLYTAVTRGKKRVWIWDGDKKKRGPAFEYFRLARLVRKNQGVSRTAFPHHATASRRPLKQILVSIAVFFPPEGGERR